MDDAPNSAGANAQDALGFTQGARLLSPFRVAWLPTSLLQSYVAQAAVRPHDTFMKNFALRTIAVIVVQQLAMIFFMRVVYLDLFLSSALSALTAMVVGLAIYLIQRRTAGSKDGL